MPIIIIFQVFHLITFENTCGNLKYIILANKGKSYYILGLILYFFSFVIFGYVVELISISLIIVRLNMKIKNSIQILDAIFDVNNIHIVCFIIGTFLPIMIFICVLILLAFSFKEYRIASLIMCVYTVVSNLMQLARGNIKYLSILYYINLFKFRNDIIIQLSIICTLVLAFITLIISLRIALEKNDYFI